MFYPANFPKKNEADLIALLLNLEETRTKFTSQKVFLQALQKVMKAGKFANLNYSSPPVWQLIFVLKRYWAKFTPKFVKNLEPILLKTQVRSWSGIVPVSIFTAGVGCPFNCTYCANEPNMPKSYFSDEPAVMRAIRHQFDPFAQVFSRLQMFSLSGHPIDKIDLIVQGGTFSFYDREYREWFIKRAFDAANTNVEELIKTGKARKQNAKSLLLAQNKNETSVQRIIGLTIETRPDYLDDEEIAFLRSLGITRIEMGVQAPDEEILKKINRGHGLKEIIDATKRVKDAGLKLTYHLMPGLPGSSPQKDLKMLGQIFSDENYKPDNIKFYPTSVVKFSELEKMHQRGEYKPYTEKALSKLILDFKQKVVPPWLRIQRLIRDLTTNDIVVDAFPSNLRQQIQAEMLAKKITCSCIRCREIKNQTKALTLKLNTIEYRANGGQEYFLEFVDDAYNLYALLRLRIPSSFFEKTKAPFVELEKAAIVRELHVYGGMVEIGKEGGTRTQHQGLGKKLLLEAEKIAKKHNAKKLAVISGIGAREYYKKLGFILEGTYMLKALC